MSQSIVKKVKAYPIAAQAVFKSGAKQVQIVKLTSGGLLAETDAAGIEAGEIFKLDLKIPVLQYEVSQSCRIIKIYGNWTTKSGEKSKAMFLLEAHFIELTKQNLMRINEFLRTIGQPSVSSADDELPD